MERLHWCLILITLNIVANILIFSTLISRYEVRNQLQSNQPSAKRAWTPINYPKGGIPGLNARLVLPQPAVYPVRGAMIRDEARYKVIKNNKVDVQERLAIDTDWRNVIKGRIPRDHLNSVLHGVNLEQVYREAVQGGPLNPLPNFKSPCWYAKLPDDIETAYKGQRCPYCNRISAVHTKHLTNSYKAKTLKNIHKRLRCLPYVYMAGVTKSGTTDLVRFLVRHPDLHKAGNKEPLWWNQDRISMSDQHTFSDYLVQFDYAAEQIDNRVLEDTGWHPGITVDGTSFLLWKEDFWNSVRGNNNLTEPKFISAHSIRAVQPDARIVVILRNPTDRLFSQFSMASFPTATGQNVSLFHQFVTTAIDDFKACVTTKSLRACAYQQQPSIANTKQISLSGSLYCVFLEEWLQVFPKEHLLVLRAEDYFRNRTSGLNKVFKFLGLELITDAAYGIHDADDLEPTFQKRDSTPMLPVTRTLLDNFFSPLNRKLAQILRDDRFVWRDI